MAPDSQRIRREDAAGTSTPAQLNGASLRAPYTGVGGSVPDWARITLVPRTLGRSGRRHSRAQVVSRRTAWRPAATRASIHDGAPKGSMPRRYQRPSFPCGRTYTASLGRAPGERGAGMPRRFGSRSGGAAPRLPITRESSCLDRVPGTTVSPRANGRLASPHPDRSRRKASAHWASVARAAASRPLPRRRAARVPRREGMNPPGRPEMVRRA